MTISPLSAQEGGDTLRVVRPLEEGGEMGRHFPYDPFRPVPGETSDEAEQLTEENFFDYFTVSAVSAWQNPIERLSRNLIFMRYRPRGYDNRFNRLTVNGADMGDLSEGFFYWKLIAGARGVFYSDDPHVAGWGAIGQTDRIETAPGATPSSGKLLYAHANRIYANRVAAGGLYNPGRGASFSVAADRRWDEDGFSKGLFTDLTALSANLELSGRGQSFNLFYTGVFGEQGVRSAATQEVFDLASDPYYNANWGEVDGRVRNAKVRSYGQNLAVASYRFDASPQLQFRATAACLFGPTATSYLTWY
ncbi:MAG: hypothetical protein LBU80_07840, partial [Rikenellaceae bacterium]|nr:hypothetical protein [Rikenellaceae bacterium]